jgi:hypothetical protein
MQQMDAHRLNPCIALVMGLLCGMMILLPGGCAGNNPSNSPNQTRYERLEAKQMPVYLRGTVLEQADLYGTEPFHISGFGLVVNLRESGDSTAPMAVREYMIRQMVKHGFGSRLVPGYERRQPEEVLRDPRVAIVRVDGFVPPGAREGDRFDVTVSALAQSRTSSLARGDLFRTDLRIDGANDMNPGGSVNVFGRAEGPVFVNPAYALRNVDASETAHASLRTGTVLDGGFNMEDRPLVLRLRQPERRLARAIERLINTRFQAVADKASRSNPSGQVVAEAQDEAVIFVYVPSVYRRDWEHFAAVVNHLFLDPSPEFMAMKARELVEVAKRPNAPLLNISYCWEAMGPAVMPYMRELMWHDSPDVAFAAARAGAFVGDPAARRALAEMAWAEGHEYQLAAVQVLGVLPRSPEVNQIVRRLLDAEQTLVRVEAYRVLARNRDPVISSKVIKEKFVLDVVPSTGRPMVYASRSGLPRIAIFGDTAALEMPISFTAFNHTLTIASDQRNRHVTVFYRGPGSRQPISVLSRPDLVELVARLGGEGAPGEKAMDFSYGDVVAILQAMSDGQKITGSSGGARVPATFVLQALPDVEEEMLTAPAIPQSRPQSDEAARAEVGR